MTIEELKEIGKKSYILLTHEEFDKLKKDAECTERTTDEYARIAREEIKKRREIEKQLAEKDKEIEELKKDLKSQKCLTDLYLTIAGTKKMLQK